MNPLIGQHITLEPLNEAHRDALRETANDPAIWSHMATSALGDNFNPWFDKALQPQLNQESIAYAIRDNANQKIIGSTRFYFIDLKHRRLDIGYTWLHPSVWGTKINLEAKYLMLTFAFETLNINRVEFMVDARNMRSQAAIKKIGAVQEGVLRKHLVLHDGYVRDSVVFSIIKEEWTDVKAMLASKLNTHH
ncbi:MAG TPA: GNAT family protein [Gammaproteobacteria bacterium]|nr:GNAT family protein [Gammaproteobacteria bacterium]